MDYTRCASAKLGAGKGEAGGGVELSENGGQEICEEGRGVLRGGEVWGLHAGMTELNRDRERVGCRFVDRHSIVMEC